MSGTERRKGVGGVRERDGGARLMTRKLQRLWVQARSDRGTSGACSVRSAAAISNQ